MPSLDDLRKRITSVKSTQKITKAMKMVAAAKLRKAQENAEKGRPYSEKMNNIILNLSAGVSDPQSAPKLLVGTGKEDVHLCVVLTSDRGLCGGFNSNIIKKAKNYFEKIQKEGKSLKIITVGSKGYDQLKRQYGKSIIENISTQIFKAMLENSASEQGSRMTAMDNATRNAGDLVDKLTIQYNRSRQAAITKELIEIISGAESL